MAENSTDGSLLDNIEILKKLRSEWEGDKPDINFFLLLGALFLFILWVSFAVYFFSRVVGLIVGTLLKRLLPFMMGKNHRLEHFSIGSFSVSLLAGKIMFRNVLYITSDYTIKINDGYVIFSYWRLVPKKSEIEVDRTKGFSSSRLHISLNGLKIHVFNRLDLYHAIAKTRQDVTASNFVSKTTKIDDTTAGRLFNFFSRMATKTNLPYIGDWYDNLWQLVGTIVIDVSSCRLIAGNQQMPYAFAITFENFASKVYISDASNPEDQYMLRLKANMENTRISLVKQSLYSTSRKPREDPPRTMNSNEFAILQSASIQFFYHQDILGLVSEEAQQQSKTVNIPVWETIWRLHKNTIISYGPWADKQRATLYSFFFPSDYETVPVTVMPKVGEPRIYIQHGVQVFFTNDASIDIWLIRQDELNAIHTKINHGSSVECTIPWICHEKGYKSIVEGSLLFLEVTTSLPFREFINCESAHFNLTTDFPRVYNAHQLWNFNLQLHRISSYIVWDHKRFFTDLINEWSADDYADLCKFVPYTWTFNINIIDKFEILLLLNDKNWIDTGTTNFAENTQAAIVGNQLLISFSLPFVDFSPELTTINYDIKAFNQLALRIYVPPQSPMEPIFQALHATSTCRRFIKPSNAYISAGPEKGFIEVWRTESFIVTMCHKFHPLTNHYYSDIPSECLDKWLPRAIESPSFLEPDNLTVNILMTESEMELSGLVARMLFDLKDNYFGNYDQISDINSLLDGSVTLKFMPERILSPEHYRPMNVILDLKLQNMRVHCLMPGSTTDSQTSDICPIFYNEQISVELNKNHSEALIQVLLAPTAVYFTPQDRGASFMSKKLDFSSAQPTSLSSGWLTLSSLQFRGNGLYSDYEVPWSVEIMEYAWLVEVVVGDIIGNLQPEHLFIIDQFFESFLLLGLFPDESNILPEKYNICHHYENIRTCPKSTKSLRCLSSDTLKYKLVRVSVDNVNLFLHSNDYAFQFATEDIRFSFCNAHNSSFSDNLILKIPTIELKQFAYYSDKETYLKCGEVNVQKVYLDIRLACDTDSLYLLEERKQFLRKHDKSLFLHFLWQKPGCACFGTNHFFADEDTNGLKFFEDGKKMAVFEINESSTQHGFYQSVIYPNKSGISFEDIPESPYELKERHRHKQEHLNLKRQLSDSSYKSANSQHSNDLNTLMENYSIYLPNYEIEMKELTQPEFWHVGAIQQWIDDSCLKLKALTDGVFGLRLQVKNKPQKQRSSSNLSTVESKEQKFTNNYAKDLTALYMRGQIADSIEIFITPLTIDIISRISSRIAETLSTAHPALITQRIYLGCTLKNHQQPLNTPSSSLSSNQNDFILKNPIYINIGLPELNVALFQSEPALIHEILPKPLNFTTSAILFYLERSRLNSETEHPPTYFQLTRQNSENVGNLRVPDSANGRNVSPIPSRLQTTSSFRSAHIQFLHFIGKSDYDQNVYSKIPFDCTTNWMALSNKTTSQLRVLCEMSVKEIEFLFSLGNSGFNQQSVSKDNDRRLFPKRIEFGNERQSAESTALSHSLEIELTTVQITSVLGKTTASTLSDSTSTELSLYEVLTPTLNIWIQMLNKFSDTLQQSITIVDEWNDLAFLKLLANSLDWDDDQPHSSKLSKNPRLYAKQFHSCGSCKLVLYLLRYISKNSALLHKDYWTQIVQSVDDFHDKKVRKNAEIALLSHWQTLICSQIQLFDNHVAQKYKCLGHDSTSIQVRETTPESSKSVMEKTPATIEVQKQLPVDSNQLLNNPDAFDAHGSVKMSPIGRIEEQYLIERQKQEKRLPHSNSTPRFPSSEDSKTSKRVSGHKRQSSAASANINFQPGHRRGPSTLTQTTVTTDVNKNEDLYHWILRAQKEHKQKHVRTLEPEKATTEVNPMELMLSVFFWTVYEKRKLDSTIVDSIPLTPYNLNFSFQLNDLKFDVIERKLLKSQSNQTFFSVNCHHLACCEGFELKGTQSYSYEMDVEKLRPLSAEIFTNYASKVHNIRLITSLASISFLNDVGVSIQTCFSALKKQKPEKYVPLARQRLNTTVSESNLDWAGSVLDKLLDYQRFASKTPQRNSRLTVNTVGTCSLKTISLESVISDLFISTTMLRLELSHAHQRFFTSKNHFSPNTQITTKPGTSTADVKASSESKPLDLITLEIRRANLILSEHKVNQRKTSETKQILNSALRQSYFKFQTFGEFSEVTNSLNPKKSNLLIDLGEIEGDLPMNAQALHEVVIKHAPQLNEQLHQIIVKRPYNFPINYTVINSPYSSDTRKRLITHQLDKLTINTDHLRDTETESMPLTHHVIPVDMEFKLNLTSLELNAQLLPSLKTKYKLTKAASSGCVGSVTQFNLEVLDHQVCFIVLKANNGEPNAPPIDTFTLELPFLKASGRYRVDSTSCMAGPNPRLIYKAGGYHDVLVTAGPMEHTFSTDLLNQILFAEQSFRSELTFLLERLSVDRPSSSLPAAKPILFNLTFQGESENGPWLQLTASTPTSTAIRFTIDGPVFILTNRLMPKPDNIPKTHTEGNELVEESISSTQPERLFGRAKLAVNVKLGQLCKSAMYEEAPEELQEYATFMTQISAQNEEVSAGALHNYIITLNRPILLIKATAIDKAILLWLNYRNTYNYWREEQRKLVMMATRHSNPNPIPSHTQQKPPTQTASPETHMNLSLNLAGSLYICMPLFSEDSDDENMSAMLVSLKKSDILVCVKKELACHAKFEAFKISFVDNFDEHSLSDEWLQQKTSDISHSNFVFFPEGSYYFCSSANPPTDGSQSAKWFLSIQSEMKGMIIDFDNKIGKLMNLCAHTLSSFAAGDDVGDEVNYAHSEASSSFIMQENSFATNEVVKQGRVANINDPCVIYDKTGTFDEMNQLAGYESKIRWLERKMHEQSMKVSDLINESKSEYEIEIARKKLRVYELARFKQFRLSMLEKLRPKTSQQRSNGTVAKHQSGFAQIREESASSIQNTPAKAVTESVVLNIDVQIKIETGHCNLRAAPTNQTVYSSGTQRVLTKRLSAKDLKNKSTWQQSQSITTLQIPSLDAKVFYTSDASRQLPQDISRTFGTQQRNSSKNKCFYMAIELAKMLEQTLVTPSLADFLEQVVEPLPESLFETSIQGTTRDEHANNENSVPIVALDTSVFPLDVFFHMTVYSSVIRFEGGEHRSSSAADCLLTLPSLTFMISTCKQDLNAGIYLSATLSNFEISIYSPHQQATSHDALSVKLDKLFLTASRTKCPNISEDDKNKVKLIIVSNVGKADFNYDMRRLAELVSFPKPWFRKKLMRRVFFGEQSIVRKGSVSTTHSAPAFSHNLTIPSTSARLTSQSPQPSTSVTTRSEWAAEVNFSMTWEDLNIKAQMSNVMGNCLWFVRKGLIQAHLQLDSFRQKTVALGFKLDSSALSAQGGAISGDISMRKLLISARHQKKLEKAPENTANIQLENIESRVEWMSRPIFIGLLNNPQISISDKWAFHTNNDDAVEESCCMINIDGSWNDLQMVITKNTTRDVSKIVHKLVSFFNDQIRSSRMVWGHYEFDRMSTGSDTSTSTQLSLAHTNDADSVDSMMDKKGSARKRRRTLSTQTQHAIEHWQEILDLLTDVQMSRKFLPLPTVKNGITFVGGVVDFRAGRISLACMNGELNAASWALFHMREASILLTCKSKYSFLDTESQSVGVYTEHRFVFKLGTQTEPLYAQGNLDECKATVCRVQHSRNFLLRHNASIELCLEAMITDVLKQMKLFKDDVGTGAPRFTHSVLQLFQFPALDATLTTIQKQLADLSPTSEDEMRWKSDVVESSFICDFHNEVAVQTDFNAQVSFLPELLKSYISDNKMDDSNVRSPATSSNTAGTSKTKSPDKLKRDSRQFVCQQWVVDPKIRFIDKFKWNPPLVDEILRKLQIFDHRTTIPKVVQRGVLDRTDLLISALLEQIIRQSMR